MTSLALAGCGKKETPATAAAEKSAIESPVPVASGNTSATSTDSANPPAAGAAPTNLQQSFAEATFAEPPPDWNRPPDKTLAGKSVGKLYTEVVRNWDDIKFVDANGKRIQYSAILETDLGSITISLRPEFAPNHVRSFVALARSGYYDGLIFERAVRNIISDTPDTKLELIEGGCPIGTGEIGYGSIGYWLKPEFSAEATHEEGTVGASHGVEDDASACKFYINLCKAPYMDGSYSVFGKVTQGLEIAQKILAQPTRNDAEYPAGDRPVQPVVIRKVTIFAE